MNNSKFDIKVFDSIPDQFVGQVDQLLENNGSNNRIQNDHSLSDYSKEHFSNKTDRLKYVVAFDRQTVIGIIILFKRKITYDGESIELGGIGGVGTKKEYRGKGIATQMLNLAKSTLEEEACDVAYLGTDINDPILLKIYGRLGFVLLPQQYTYLGKSGKRYFENNGLLAPIKSNEIFHKILKSSEAFDIGNGNW